MPTLVTGPIDAADPTHHWWAGRPHDWLSLQAGTGSADLPVAGITRIVRCPGSTRAIALLAPGSRGSEARLDLVLAADPLAETTAVRRTATRVALIRAPWEVED